MSQKQKWPIVVALFFSFFIINIKYLDRMQHLLNQVWFWPFALKCLCTFTISYLLIESLLNMRACRVVLQREVLAVPPGSGLWQSGPLREGGQILLLPSPHAAVLGSHAQTAVGWEPTRFLPTAQICLHLLYRSAPAPRLPRRLRARRSDAQWIHQSHRYGWWLFRIKN